MAASPSCPSCGAANDADARFCDECGGLLAPTCESCGAPYAPGKRFCKRCGSALAPDVEAASTPPTPPSHVEMRIVSVLFVDLVGYTSLSERRDAEDVRDLLSRYFDAARTIVDRYGGTVDKFIGDAVMTVWGAPVAREDDAERAVRAGLEIVDAVAAFGEEVGAPALRARAGVVTGQAALMPNPGEGLVVGDRVNAASRVQSVAAPGTVYVDEVTRQASSAAIVYADAGVHALKGKTEPLQLWQAERVVAGVGGAYREEGLVAPFVGRDAELRLVKHLFHATVERGTARLVAVLGAPGAGKSRLRREFEHHVDGLVDDVLWHAGRCLSYGERVAYCALGEMVRQRVGIPEETPPEEANRRLAVGLERWILDPAERAHLLPRLGALIGSADPGLERQDLFAGWRLFFERLADHGPVVLAFEDLHWADDGLLDFIEHVLTWSAHDRIFIVCCARPELADRRGWDPSRPAFTPIFLEPLDAGSMGALLDGLVADLPAVARDRVVERAEGIPLYALETVRALADHGVVAPGPDGRLVVRGDIGELSVPTTLSSLLTARLDALPADERALVGELAVWGGAFTRTSVSAISDAPEARIDAMLGSLVRKQILAVRADPLAPDRGQYGFAQNMLRTVAYEMLPRRERKARHLAAAAHLVAVYPNDGEEMAELIAAHRLHAYRAGAVDPDADDLRRDALAELRRAARRAETVACSEAAERSYRTALELVVDESERLELTEAAGTMATRASHYEDAIELFQAAADAHAAAGRERDAARLAGHMGLALRCLGRGPDAIERLREALAVLDPDSLDPDVAALNLELGTALLFAGHREEAAAPLERALTAAEALMLPAVLCGALTSTGIGHGFADRRQQEREAHRTAAMLAERHGIVDVQMRAQSNLGEALVNQDDPEARDALEAGLALARRLGERGFEGVLSGNLMRRDLLTGRWDLVERVAAERVGQVQVDSPDDLFVHQRLTTLCALRGDIAAAHRHLERLEHWRTTEDVEDRSVHAAAEATVALADGRHADVLAADVVARTLPPLGAFHEAVRQAWPDAVEAAFALDRLEDVDVLVDQLARRPRGYVPPYLHAQLARTRGRLAAARAEHAGVEPGLRGAIDAFAGLDYRFWLARARTDLAAWLVAQERGADAAPLLDQAIAALEALGAAPELARARGLRLSPGTADRSPAAT